jgi:fused signal recognition particle receptor
MFGKLREKLKSWTQGLVKKTEEKREEVEKTSVEKKEIKQKEPAEEEKEMPAKPDKKTEKIQKLEKETEKGLDKKSFLITESPKKGKKKETREEPPELEPLPEITKPEEILVKQEEKSKGFFKKLFGKKEEKTEEPKTQKAEIPREIQETEEPEQNFLSKLKSKITKVKVSEEDFNTYSEDLEMILIENNVALEVAEKIIQNLKQRIIGKELLKKEIEGQIREYLKDIMFDVLLEPFDLVDRITDKQEKPYVLLFCGINGTGKTTTIAKLAKFIRKRGLSCILAGADTFRAASIEQIKKHGEALDIKVIAHDYGSDPASVGFDAISYAKKNKIDVVLIDTAGRMHTEKNLLREIEKISRVCNPDLKIFVGESITGNDSIEQVRAFNSSIGIDAIILTKADTDEKGGTALSLGYITKKPILYLGTGQGYDSIEPFSKAKFVEALGL